MQTQSVDPTLAEPGEYRATWTLPLVFSRRDPRVLYFANQRLFRTEDGGRHWTAISPDLTREDPGVPATLDPATAVTAPRPGPSRGVIYAVAPSRVADGDLWVGTDDGLVWRTRDEGRTWTNVTPAALTPWSNVGILEASPFEADTAYADARGRRPKAEPAADGHTRPAGRARAGGVWRAVRARARGRRDAGRGRGRREVQPGADRGAGRAPEDGNGTARPRDEASRDEGLGRGRQPALEQPLRWVVACGTERDELAPPRGDATIRSLASGIDAARSALDARLVAAGQPAISR